jgi:NADPH:quinone reductase-like Zn-dependent oxidoreductase
MRAYEIQEFGIDNLRMIERPDPKPGPGQILMKVHASSLNFRDLMMVQGLYNPRQPLPLIPNSDGAGEVIAVGDGVTRVAVGDRVAGIFAQGWIEGRPTREKIGRSSLGSPLDGMLTELAVLDAEGVVPIPDHLAYDEAATLPCAGVTAWSALYRHGNLQPGETLLVLGTGGVSMFAMQFAKAAGARVIVTSSSDAKLERARELGADYCVNYNDTPDWHKPVREFTGGVGVDQVIEVGGVGTLGKSLRSVRMGGTISLIGVLAGRDHQLDLTAALMQDVRIQGVIVGPRTSFEEMNAAIAANELKPIVDQAFHFDDALSAYKLMAEGGHFGKVCVNISG